MLEVTNLSKRYGQKQAIDGISFSIRQGEAVGFLGINGAGKSTTMNILTGYLSASDGEVVIDGVDILTEPLKAKAKIGYLPEQPPLYLDMKVIEYLRFLYELKKVKKNPNIKQTQQEYLEQIMELVKIKEVSERVIRNLSKGYRQRVGLAQALVGDPQLLILDEPTVGLDPAQIIEIRQLIRQLAKTRTVLLSSHILSEVQAVCDRIIILHQGHIVADASQEELTGQMGGQMQLQLEVEGNSKTVLETLRKIGGIAEVHRQEEKQYLLHLEEGCKSEAVRREIFKAFSRLFERDGSCLLLSMQEKGRTLEEVFMQLTAQDVLASEQEHPQTEDESEEEEGKPMAAIYKREMHSYLTSAVGYVFLAVFFAISGYYFFATSLVSNSTDLSYVFSNLFSIAIFLVPLLTMKLFSEERKQRTEQLLFTAPVRFTGVVLGKFFASLTMYLLGMSVTLVYFLVMCAFRVPDVAIFAGNFLGLLLLGAALCAIGIFISALTESQVIAAVGSLAIGMFLLFANSFTPVVSNQLLNKVMDAISFYDHYLSFTRGLIHLSDLTFFISVTVLFLFLTVRHLERRRIS